MHDLCKHFCFIITWVTWFPSFIRICRHLFMYSKMKFCYNQLAVCKLIPFGNVCLEKYMKRFAALQLINFQMLNFYIFTISLSRLKLCRINNLYFRIWISVKLKISNLSIRLKIIMRKLINKIVFKYLWWHYEIIWLLINNFILIKVS